MPLEPDYAGLAADAVCDLQPYLPGKPAEELEREYGISNAIKLASNENSYGASPAVIATLKPALHQLNRYPDGAGFRLRAALAEHLKVNAHQLVLGNGSNDLLVQLAETFLSVGRSAIYDQYSFVVYRTAVQATGAQARIAPSSQDRDGQYLGHDLGAMLSLIDKSTRLIFIANPNNPTGTWVTSAALRKFLAVVPDHVLVVLDEAYYEYALGPDIENSVPWLTEFPNLIILRTFSKAYGLAGLRVGYAVCAEGIVELLNRVRQPFNVNQLAQVAALAALQDPNWIAAAQTNNLRDLQLLENGLSELQIPFLQSRGNFLLADFGAQAMQCYEYLLQHGVIVRPVSNYGLPDYLRISVGTTAETIVLLTQLADFQKGAS